MDDEGGAPGSGIGIRTGDGNRVGSGNGDAASSASPAVLTAKRSARPGFSRSGAIRMKDSAASPRNDFMRSIASGAGLVLAILAFPRPLVGAELVPSLGADGRVQRSGAAVGRPGERRFPAGAGRLGLDADHSGGAGLLVGRCTGPAGDPAGRDRQHGAPRLLRCAASASVAARRLAAVDQAGGPPKCALCAA